MIYNTTINAVNESELDELLENAEDRFEYETMAEATAIVIAEQEQNWTKFMKGVGLSELASIQEGEEVIYEGARLQKFVSKAIAYFQMALNKLAEITKRFIAEVDRFLRPTDSFIKKYGSKLNGAKVDEFKGYRFQNLNKAPTFKDAKAPSDIKSVNKDDYTKEKAENDVIPSNTSGESFMQKAFVYYFGAKEKTTLNNVDCSGMVQVLKNTKQLRKDANSSYKEAAKAVKKLIKDLKKAEKDALKDNVEKKADLATSANVESNYSAVISYWKTYSNCILMRHGTYLRALGARHRQAKAICTKAITKSLKDSGTAKREQIKARTESYVETDAFLDAVDFI